jgi:CSLREA domain-containing protein
MPRRRYPYTLPTLILSLLLVLMSFPASPNHFFNFPGAQASAASIFTVNSTGDAADSNPGDGICNDGTSACTLRAAIQEANTLQLSAAAINFRCRLFGSMNSYLIHSRSGRV